MSLRNLLQCIYIYIYILYIYICICICVYILIDNRYIQIYILASNFTKWKIFHQCFLIPQSGETELIFFIPLYFCFYFQEVENISQFYFTSTKWKDLDNLRYFQNEKISNKKTGKYVSLHKKKWSNFLYFTTYLNSFPQSGKHFIVAIYFYKMHKKLSNFLYFYIHISFHFHKVDYISPMRFISTKWKIFHQRAVFL